MVTSSDYRRFIEGVVRDIGEHGDAVILGHGAGIILADRADNLRILITGTAKPRAQRIVEMMDVDEKQALKVVERTDRERVDYFRRFYNSEWLSPTTYDLCLNSDKLSTDDMVGIILHTLHAS
jgi:cytidylate kinase